MEKGNEREIPFEQLEQSDLIVDAIYKGGPQKTHAAEPLLKILPKCGVSGGFRKVNRKDDPSKVAYVVLYTTMEELEWPDFLDKETGLFRYYGDNRKAGNGILDTKAKGNLLLETVFSMLKDPEIRKDIPPFLVFKKGKAGRDKKFLGLAAPGNPKLSSDKSLVAFWRTYNGDRFQNYEAYFTILDTGKTPISKKWLELLIEDHEKSLAYAPDAWISFIEKGVEGIKPLKAPSMKQEIPNKYRQLQTDEEGRICLSRIREFFETCPQGFESCAADIVQKMDSNFTEFTLTRPWRDGGRDALGYYQISQESIANYPLKIECAMEAKCYGESHGVGVRDMSRLISRLRYRQFGVMVTTGFVNKQAYEEVVEDEQPILIVTGSDIASILRKNSITSENIEDWMKSCVLRDTRFTGTGFEMA